jgi:hypothetical protein
MWHRPGRRSQRRVGKLVDGVVPDRQGRVGLAADMSRWNVRRPSLSRPRTSTCTTRAPIVSLSLLPARVVTPHAGTAGTLEQQPGRLRTSPASPDPMVLVVEGIGVADPEQALGRARAVLGCSRLGCTIDWPSARAGHGEEIPCVGGVRGRRLRAGLEDRGLPRPPGLR